MKHFFSEQQKNLLTEFLNSYKKNLDSSTLELLYLYAECVIKGNESTNLISKNDIPKFLSRHITDSLIPFCILPEILELKDSKIRWADMGSGGGCPIFPLAIALPHIQFFAVEPRNRRVQFLQETKEFLNLKNLEVIGKRFETSGLNNLDYISCRALSSFENDWERAKPALNNKGTFITLKSYETISHLENKTNISVIKYNLPEEERQYAIVFKRFS